MTEKKDHCHRCGREGDLNKDIQFTPVEWNSSYDMVCISCLEKLREKRRSGGACDTPEVLRNVTCPECEKKVTFKVYRHPHKVEKYCPVCHATWKTTAGEYRRLIMDGKGIFWHQTYAGFGPTARGA